MWNIGVWGSHFAMYLLHHLQGAHILRLWSHYTQHKEDVELAMRQWPQQSMSKCPIFWSKTQTASTKNLRRCVPITDLVSPLVIPTLEGT